MVACSVPKKEKKEEPVTLEVSSVVSSSDSEAVILANEVMEAMGGEENWNNTRFLSWNFFGSRKLLWDKWTGDVRIDFLKADMKILMNIREMSGRVWKDGGEVSNTDSVDFYLNRGKSIWINDSYWLVMPFKLNDPGVTLKYEREDTTLIGEASHVLTMTFEKVGDTPENKYEVWIDKQKKLVNQWAYYRTYEDTEARFTLPWGNYQPMGKILLSDDRGDRDLTEVEVLTEVPDGIFEEF